MSTSDPSLPDRRTLCAALLTLGASATGCAPDDARPQGMAIGGQASNVGSGAGRYPTGPYGQGNPEVGDIVENLEFYGYVARPGQITPTDGPLVPWSLQDLRDTGAPYALIHVTAIWCGTCQAEAYYLSRYNSAIVGAGGVTLEIVVDSVATGADPTQEQLSDWIVNLDLESTTMGPANERLREVFPEKDFVYIVDLKTMEVVWREEGPSGDPTGTELGAFEILSKWLAD